MKKFITFILCFTALHSVAQNGKEFDPRAWKPPYSLELDGWGIEMFLIPIDFAPQIPYKGVEDIRFTKGWADSTSNDYWAYAFLWCLDGSPEITSDSMAHHLNSYYDGLVSRNIEKRAIPANMIVKTKTKIKLVPTQPGDLKTFEGAIAMLDYMGKRPITLNCKVHLKLCNRKTILFHQLSPKPYNHNGWQKLNQLWSGFSCSE